MFERVDPTEAYEFWNEKYGVPLEVLGEYDVYMKGRNKTWLVDKDAAADKADVEAIGLPFLRVKGEHPKPTTDALQRLDEHVTRNRVEVGVDGAREFVAGETVERDYPDVELGYVAVEHRGEVLGCGLYFPGELRSQVPKGRRVDLLV
ncbi:MAG: methyltransferase RsmF C-terminal domain-like protein [Halobacteriales archaeon]